MVGIPVVIITSWILYERSELSFPFIMLCVPVYLGREYLVMIVLLTFFNSLWK